MEFSLLGLFISILTLQHVSGQCSFPGRPKNGKVAFGSDVAVFECDEGFLLNPINSTRECLEDGTWSRNIPSCLIRTEIRTGDPLFGLVRGNSFTVPIQGQLYGIQLATFGRLWDLLSTANWTVEFGASDNFELASFVREDDEVMHLITYIFENSSSIRPENVRFTLDSDLAVIRSKHLLTFPNECGLPEQPAHGNFTILDNVATYSCDSGFALNSNDSTRLCSEGVWLGDQLKCVTLEKARPIIEEPSLVVDIILPVIFIGGALMVSFVIAYVSWKKSQEMDRQEASAVKLNSIKLIGATYEEDMVAHRSSLRGTCNEEASVIQLESDV